MEYFFKEGKACSNPCKASFNSVEPVKIDECTYDYELEAKVLFSKEDKEYWDDFLKYFGCSLSDVVVKGLRLVEEHAENHMEYNEKEIKKGRQDTRQLFI